MAYFICRDIEYVYYGPSNRDGDREGDSLIVRTNNQSGLETLRSRHPSILGSEVPLNYFKAQSLYLFQSPKWYVKIS